MSHYTHIYEQWRSPHSLSILYKNGHTLLFTPQVLLRLALEAEMDPRTRAAQGLARIAITIEPNIAFPGQRMYEVVRPLVDLLSVDVEYLENYEALLALTNFAAHSDSLRLVEIIVNWGLGGYSYDFFDFGCDGRIFCYDYQMLRFFEKIVGETLCERIR